MQIRRLEGNPIIRPNMDSRMGSNINGPSLIRVPPWLPNPMGRYYLYFADHGGKYIRLAYADALEGPWRMHEPGVLPLEESGFVGHLASPDVHVDHERKQIRMYYHGVIDPPLDPGQAELSDRFYCVQRSRVALSADGLTFQRQGEPITSAYLRVWRYGGWCYGLTMPALIYRSRDGLTNFHRGPNLIPDSIDPATGSLNTGIHLPRHSAVRVVGDTLQVFHSRIEMAPEHIMLSTVDLTRDWHDWQLSEPVSVIRPEHDWEGADCPHVPSRRGAIHERAWQLRDPAVFEDEDGRAYLLYSVAGEAGIGIAEIV